jgi:ribose 5-phosphate isomerase B
MKVYVATDHNGQELKKQLLEFLSSSTDFEVVGVGDELYAQDDDFTDYAALVVGLMRQEPLSRGILLCGSGQGVMMAANRFKGVRAGLGWSTKAAHDLRNDEDSNVLTLSSQQLSGNEKLWKSIVTTWLETPFAGVARYNRRNQALDTLY